MSAPVGKSKGCFQCTKRRIVCDKTEPSCGKCQKKGIECSGPQRIRFSTGVAQRGHLKGCAIPVADAPPQWTVETHLQALATVPRKIRWKDDQRERAKRRTPVRTTNSSAENQVTPSTAFGTDFPSQLRPSTDVDSTEEITDADEVDAVVDPTYQKGLVRTPDAFVVPWLAPIDSRTRMFMSHFADQVAPVMVVLDIANGYREILLPMACENELLQRAVGVVAAQHLAIHQPRYQQVADEGRAAVISRLRRDSLWTSPERVFNVSTWATLIVLLVGETITGSSEYGYLLQSLLCLAQNIARIEPSAAHHFLTQQTHMFEFLGLPFLGERHGVDLLRLPLEPLLDWIILYDLPQNSEHSRLLQVSKMAFIKASEIYLGRVASDQDQWERLESLKQLVAQIEPDQMGSHALVWVCFIAAADSTDPEHRQFFVDRMNQVFSRTRFQNIASGMQSLPAIWSQRGSTRWTQTLTQLAPSLVM